MPDGPGAARFLASREVRVIPTGWHHPRDAEGRLRPLLPEQMPAVAGGATAILAYETVSEGTPISPAFPNTGDGRLALVRHCVAHCFSFGHHRAGPEAWAAILFGHDTTVGFDGSVHN